MTSKIERLTPQFVEFIPSTLLEGVLYISIPYATASHLCCCGRCGMKVVTPLSPEDWELVYDGETVSLEPSIGNWSFECQSHYWIRRNNIVWAEAWSKEKIYYNRKSDQIFRALKSDAWEDTSSKAVPNGARIENVSFWSRLKKFFGI